MYTYTYDNKEYTNYLGNYWLDHEASDSNYDGIGEKAVIFTNSHVWYVDEYPLVQFYEKYELIEPYFPPKRTILGYNMFLVVAIIAFSLLLILMKNHKITKQN
ncbi:MAG: hypothetical protein JW776_09035 [Candidatus Lokiarchaeota archaeon]|nr:hypothetical protein [Candidatus Lokiarchaeota archaeon]